MSWFTLPVVTFDPYQRKISIYKVGKRKDNKLQGQQILMQIKEISGTVARSHISCLVALALKQK